MAVNSDSYIHVLAILQIIREGDADDDQVERARSLKAGALWHIFKAADTDKIRKLILKVRTQREHEQKGAEPLRLSMLFVRRDLASFWAAAFCSGTVHRLLNELF